MALDKWIAMIFLVISVVYGYAAYNYPLLPFERNMTFLPNTMPMVLGVFGALFALMILLSPKPKADEKGDVLGDINLEKWREYKVGQAVALIVAMIVFALALRPVGFIATTVLFIVGSGWILGERRLPIMITAALIGTLAAWFLVHQVLGIFLSPFPAILSGG